MSYKPTKAELALMEPGVCTTCGADSPDGRNSAGHCTACHNAQYHARKAREAARLAETKVKAAEYWAARGIKVGEKLQTIARDMLTGGLLATRWSSASPRSARAGRMFSARPTASAPRADFASCRRPWPRKSPPRKSPPRKSPPRNGKGCLHENRRPARGRLFHRHCLRELPRLWRSDSRCWRIFSGQRGQFEKE